MKWTAVDSSQIAEVGYNEETSTLGLRFKNKSGISEYHYADVPQDLHAGLLTALSVGKFFGEHIKSRPDLYPFTKVS